MTLNKLKLFDVMTNPGLKYSGKLVPLHRGILIHSLECIIYLNLNSQRLQFCSRF